MKILLSGAQGTGKSTLAKLLVKEYNLTLIDSMSKKFMINPNVQLDINDEINYLEFQTKITLHHLDNIVNKDNFVCSRSIADSYAYLIYAHRHTDNIKVRSTCKNFLRVVKTCTEIQKKQKDVFNIYVPIMFDINSGGNSLRVIDKNYQIFIDDLIESYYIKNNIEYYKLKSTDIDSRITEIKGMLDD